MQLLVVINAGLVGVEGSDDSVDVFLDGIVDLKSILQESVLLDVLEVPVKPSVLEFSLETNVGVEDIMLGSVPLGEDSCESSSIDSEEGGKGVVHWSNQGLSAN